MPSSQCNLGISMDEVAEKYSTVLCCCLHSGSDGSLSTVAVKDGGIRPTTLGHTVPSVQGQASMVTLDDLHIAVAGVHKEGKGLLASFFELQ